MKSPMKLDRSVEEVWRGRAVSRVHALGQQLYRVELSGTLRQGWLASLGLELASRNLSIDRGTARRGDKGVWNAEIDLVRLTDDVDPLGLSYVQLAESGRTVDAALPIRIDRYTLVDSPLHGGCLELSFDAADSLGLLGRVLADLAMLVLFPVELRVETNAGRVRDRLWLSGIHSAPSLEARALLMQRLERHVRASDAIR